MNNIDPVMVDLNNYEIAEMKAEERAELREQAINEQLDSIEVGDFMELFNDQIIDFEQLFDAYKDDDGIRMLAIIDLAFRKYTESVVDYA